MDMTPLRIELLAKHLSDKLNRPYDMILGHLQDWFTAPIITDPTPTYEIVALYDKGFGPECMNLPTFKVAEDLTVEEIQKQAEAFATQFFEEKFRGKVEWQEIKIRPAK
jgi:hypothetical protein